MLNIFKKIVQTTLCRSKGSEKLGGNQEAEDGSVQLAGEGACAEPPSRAPPGGRQHLHPPCQQVHSPQVASSYLFNGSHFFAFFRELSTLHLKVVGNFRRSSTRLIEFPALYGELINEHN